METLLRASVLFVCQEIEGYGGDRLFVFHGDCLLQSILVAG